MSPRSPRPIICLLSLLLLAPTPDSMCAQNLSLKIIGPHINAGRHPLTLNNIPSNTTILALKQKIQESQNIPVTRQKLIHNARRLDNHTQTLADYHISNNASINCTRMLQDRSPLQDIFSVEKIQGACFLLFIYGFFLSLLYKERFFQNSKIPFQKRNWHLISPNSP